MTPEELVADACPKIRDLGWAFYFVPETFATGAALGLDPVHFYFLGRGGVLGDVEAAVVTSAFGYFKPSLVEAVWNAGRQKVAPRDAGRAFLECAAAHGRRKLSAIEALPEFCAAADAVNGAADPTGLALYAAAAAEPLVEDPPGRAMQLVSILRELRGSTHLLAVRAAGLDAKTAHFIRRPDDAAMFGWSDDDAPIITDEHRARLERADALTDELVLPAYAVLDDAGRRAFTTGLDAIEAALTGS
jgi:hypothetical protein